MERDLEEFILVLEKIVAGTKVRGLAGQAVVEVVRVQWIGSDALTVVYRGSEDPAEVLLYRDTEQRIELVQASGAFSFDGEGETFKIASEVQRMRRRLAQHASLSGREKGLKPPHVV